MKTSEFPHTQPAHSQEMALMYEFAKHAMQSFIILGEKDYARIAVKSFRMAEAMLLEKENYI